MDCLFKGYFWRFNLSIKAFQLPEPIQLTYIYSYVSHLKGQCTNTANWLA